MHTPVSDRYTAVDAYVDRELLRLKVPGACLAIVAGGQIVHMRGFGHAGPFGRAEPVGAAESVGAPTPQTPFFIGSITKSFTALAIMQLVERGQVDLDAPVRRYLSWFRVADPDVSAAMTVRHLLNQTSGFSMVVGSATLGDTDDRPDACERQVRALSTYRSPRPPGAAFDYSNTNFNILGLIVEAVSGESYADYLRNCIFNPLGMTHSYAGKAEARRNGLATGHRYWFWRPFPEPDLPVPTGSLAAGQLISSAEDLAHYVIALLDGGRYDGAGSRTAGHVLSPAGIAEMHRGATEVEEMGISIGQYGMGWFISEVGAPDASPQRAVWHSGLVPNFSAFVALLPQQKMGLVLLLNAGHFWMEPITNEFGLAATAILAGQQPGPSPMPWLAAVPAVMRALPLLPLLQAVGLARALRPGAPRGRRMLPALLPNLAFAALPVLLRAGPLAGFLKLYAPDIWRLAHVSGGLAALGAVVQVGWALSAPRDNRKGGSDG